MSRSQAVVCVSTPRMYPRSGYFLVDNNLKLQFSFFGKLEVQRRLEEIQRQIEEAERQMEERQREAERKLREEEERRRREDLQCRIQEAKAKKKQL